MNGPLRPGKYAAVTATVQTKESKGLEVKEVSTLHALHTVCSGMGNAAGEWDACSLKPRKQFSAEARPNLGALKAFGSTKAPRM